MGISCEAHTAGADEPESTDGNLFTALGCPPGWRLGPRRCGDIRCRGVPRPTDRAVDAAEPHRGSPLGEAGDALDDGMRVEAPDGLPMKWPHLEFVLPPACAPWKGESRYVHSTQDRGLVSVQLEHRSTALASDDICGAGGSANSNRGKGGQPRAAPLAPPEHL